MGGGFVTFVPWHEGHYAALWMDVYVKIEPIKSHPTSMVVSLVCRVQRKYMLWLLVCIFTSRLLTNPGDESLLAGLAAVISFL